MATSSNPGALPGTEIVFLQEPFGGIVQNLTGVETPPNLVASQEGVEATLTGKQSITQYAESNGMTLFKKEKLGHLSAGPVMSQVADPNNYVTALPVNGVVGNAQSGSAWILLENGRVVRLAYGGTTVLNEYDVNLAETSGAPNGYSYVDHSGHTPVASTKDIDDIVFTDLDGVEWVIYSWEDSTDGDVAIMKTSNPSARVDGWYSLVTESALTKGVPHKILQAPNGEICITNGDEIAQIQCAGGLDTFDSSDTQLDPAVPFLSVGVGWQANSIANYKSYLAVGASTTTAISSNGSGRGQCRLFLFDGTSATPQYVFDIPDNYLNAIFFDGTTLWVMTNGRNNTYKIWEFTGTAVKKAYESAMPLLNQIPTQGNFETVQDSMIFGSLKPNNLGAYLFRWYGGGMHCEAYLEDINSNVATDVGMVKNLYLDSLYIGVQYAGGYELMLYDDNAQSRYQPNAYLKTILFSSGILGRRTYPLGFKGTMNRIYLYLSQWGTGASLYLSLFKDYTTAAVGGSTDLLNLLIDTNTAIGNGYQASGSPFGSGGAYYHYAFPAGTTEMDISDIAIEDLSSFYMMITWNHASDIDVAAIIRKLVAYWNPSQ